MFRLTGAGFSGWRLLCEWSDSGFGDRIFEDVVENAFRGLLSESKGCFQPIFCGDVVAVTTQSSKVSHNREFDMNRDP